MKLDRTKITVKQLTADNDDEYVDLPQAERVMEVWPITQEIWDIAHPGYAEQRLQRNITALIRRES